MNTRIKKLILYFLILVFLVGVGVFGAIENVNAQAIVCTAPNTPAGCIPPPGKCWSNLGAPISHSYPVCIGYGTTQGTTWGLSPSVIPIRDEDTCWDQYGGELTQYTSRTICVGPTTNPTGNTWGKSPSVIPTIPPEEPATTKTGDALYDNLSTCISLTTFDMGACLVYFSYLVFYTLPSFLLTFTARFFDILIAVTLSTKLYGSFISSAWEVVRDFSNIFFILILLYIAIKVILGLGGSEVKKMIVNVIIMALLINFSMFMTKVVIDTSNILALIFYNKISVTGINYIPTLSPIKSGVQDKDVAGTLVSRFDPSKLLTQDFFDSVRKKTYEFSATGFAAYVVGGAIAGSWVPVLGTLGGALIGTVGYVVSSGAAAVPHPLMLGIILISGAVMLFAAYAFFIAGLSFLGRLIELWILIISSPFAFMSFSLPILKGKDYIGWDAWLKRLLTVSFMAPIFMFFLYLITKIIEADPIGSLADRTADQQGWMETMLLLIIPAVIILTLLLKATEFAKKGSGAMGEAIIKGGTMLAGVAGGLALGGAAFAGRVGLGGGGGYLANKLADKVGPGRIANKLRDVSDFARKSSFDVRATGVGKGLTKATGLNLGEANKGSWTEMKKQQVEKRQKRADELEKRGTGKEKKTVDEAEIKLKEATLPVKLDLANVDKDIDKARKELSDAKLADADDGSATSIAAKAQMARAKLDLDDANRRKAIIRGAEYKDPATGAVVISQVAGGIADLEKRTYAAKQALDVASDKITTDYAKAISGGLSKSLNMIFKAGAYSLAGADEAARKIRTGTKLDSGEKPH